MDVGWRTAYTFAGDWGYRDDGDMGLLYIGARWYDPTVGRWTSADKWLGNIYQPLSLNWYLYGDDDTVNEVGAFREPTRIGDTNYAPSSREAEQQGGEVMSWQWFVLSAGVVALVLLIASLVVHTLMRSSPPARQVGFAIWGDAIAAVSILTYVLTQLAEIAGRAVPAHISLLALFMSFVGLMLSASRIPVSIYPERNSWLSGFLQGICAAFAVIIAAMLALA